MDEKGKRNKNISYALLRGDSAAATGKKFRLSGYSCVEILRNYCWRLDPLLYKSLKPELRDMPLEVLRENKKIFLGLDSKKNTITENSKIWELKELSNSTVEALLFCEIHTVDALCLLNEKNLLRIPMIGIKSFEILKKALNKNGFKLQGNGVN